jgi:hypothetical protein
MARTRFWDRRSARRIAFVDAFEFPSSVRQRFAERHRRLSVDEIGTVEAATRQWFRLAATHPKARLSMPSVVVDDLWHELVLHTREYAAFCDAALGRFLHHTPESAMDAAAAAANHSTGLVATLRLARQDEGCGPQELPLLFRVDQELGVVGGRRYLIDCGGRGQCHDTPGLTCLQHLTGVGKPVRGGWDSRHAPDVGVPGAGCGAGCGGGDG